MACQASLLGLTTMAASFPSTMANGFSPQLPWLWWGGLNYSHCHGGTLTTLPQVLPHNRGQSYSFPRLIPAPYKPRESENFPSVSQLAMDSSDSRGSSFDWQKQPPTWVLAYCTPPLLFLYPHWQFTANWDCLHRLANRKYQVPGCNLVKRKLGTGGDGSVVGHLVHNHSLDPQSPLHAGWLWQPPVIPALGGGVPKESWL